MEGSQQALDQASEVTLVLEPVPAEALPLEQLEHILGPEELFVAHPQAAACHRTGRDRIQPTAW